MKTLRKTRPYVAILLFIFMLGVEFSFGLLSAPKQAKAIIPLVQTVPESVIGVVAASHTAADTPRTLREQVLNPIAKGVAQVASTLFLRSLADWVRRGFKGQPQFVKNPEKFFKRLVSQALLTHNLRAAASRLCYPFGTGTPSITIPDIPGYPRLKCTLKNPSRARSFFNDFSQGGFDMFNQILRPENNFYGQILLLNDERTFGVQDKRKQGELEQISSQGFVGIKNCAVNVAFASVVNGKDFKSESCADFENVTPGSVVAKKVSATLEQDVGGWVNVHELSDLIGAVVNVLLNKLIGTKFMCLSCAGKTPAKGTTINVGGSMPPQCVSAKKGGTCADGKWACSDNTAICRDTSALCVFDANDGGSGCASGNCVQCGGSGGGTSGDYCNSDAQCPNSASCQRVTKNSPTTSGSCRCVEGVARGGAGSCTALCSACPTGDYSCKETLTGGIGGCYTSVANCQSACSAASDPECATPCP
ncbi:MAG: hypothetical protein Q7S09_05770 [bacterium]|nr:hypothetical protein [bacterium]